NGGIHDRHGSRQLYRQCANTKRIPDRQRPAEWGPAFYAPGRIPPRRQVFQEVLSPPNAGKDRSSDQAATSPWFPPVFNFQENCGRISGGQGESMSYRV